MHISRLALVALAASVAFSSVSEARTRTRSGKVQTDRGRSATVVENTQREPGAFHRDRTITGENGHTATQTVDRTWDKDNGTGTINRTQTGPAGNTRSVNGTVVRNDDGTVSSTGTYERKNGSTGTYSTTTEKTANGRATTGTVTGAHGNTATVDRSVVRDGNTSTRSTTTTGPNGGTRSAATTTTVENGTATRTHTVTSPSGETRSRTVTATKDQPAP